VEAADSDLLTAISEWPRSVVASPASFHGRKLNQRELTFWTQLEAHYAPVVLGDAAGDSDDSELPSPLNIGWCALYPLAIYFMGSRRRKAMPDTSRPQGPEWIEWDSLLNEFWQRRQWQLYDFQRFLADWDLSEVLGTPKHLPLTKVNTQDYDRKTPYAEDRKVLGLHRFERWEQVVDYALRWGRNPLIRDTHLWEHRITLSRGIDLVCSELLANGFEHSGTTKAEVFIMAKLCSHESAWRALELNKSTPYLTCAEFNSFTLAAKYHCPILQLCIGDTGQGFGGNEALKQQFLAAFPQNKNDPDEGTLINFALSGNVSTKTREHHRSFWRKQTAGEDDAIPTTHGLAEVSRFVRKMHGYWKIHSRSTVVDQDFFNPPPVVGDRPPRGKPRTARPVAGCLHYFMFPLLQEDNLPVLRPFRPSLTYKSLDLIDAADDALANDPVQVRIEQPEKWVGSFCDRIVRAKSQHGIGILLHLGAFDHLEEKDLQDACLDLIRCLHCVRDEIAVFLSGASETTRYQLSRYTASRAFDLEYRILPFLDFQSSANGGVQLQLACSQAIQEIEADLARVLSGDETAEVLKSDEPRRWALFRRVYEENQTLFHITRISTVGDEVFRANVQLCFTDPKATRLLFGGTSFSELAASLQHHQAVARYSSEGYFRRGEMLPTYVHVGRLWADREFQLRVVNWLHIAVHQAQPLQAGIGSDGSGLAIIAYLHPAIELAHELVRRRTFAGAQIVEIRRASELRWDFEQLLKVHGKKVAVLIDVVLTGKTVRNIVGAVSRLGLEPWACFSVLSVEGCDLGIQEHAFCTCTADDLKRLSERSGK